MSISVYLILHILNRFKEFTSKEKKKIVIAGAVFVTGVFLVFVQYYFFVTKLNRFGAFEQAPYYMTLRTFWNSFFPIPGTTGINFWNTNIIPFPLYFHQPPDILEFITAGNIFAVVASFLILLISIFLFSRKLPVLICFLINISLQLVFLQYLSIFFVRYQGFLFIIFIYNYWLLSYSDEKLSFLKLDRVYDFLNNRIFVFFRKSASPFITIILLVQFCTGIFAYAQDIRYPFTASYKTAEYIRENNLHNNIMVGHIDYAAQSIAGHLNKKIYYPQSNEYGTNVLWGENRRINITLNDIINSSVILLNKYDKDILLILNYPLWDQKTYPIGLVSIRDNIQLKYINEFTETIVNDERYFLYLMYSSNN
jgi:hypothetical protein